MPDHHALFADIHCHPGFKPYGQSFTAGNERPHPEPADIVSLWHESPVTAVDKLLSEKLGVAMYTQSDLMAAAQGGLQVLGISVGALEQEFVTIKRPLPAVLIAVIKAATGGVVDVQNFLINLVTRFGTARLNKVREAQAYFPDLLAEISYVKNQEGKVFRLADSKYYTFRLATNGAMIDAVLAANAWPEAGTTADTPITLCLVLSMEGLHNLDALHADEATVLAHVQYLKRALEVPLFFVTFCHHFWNGLCGHALSLPALLSSALDQRPHEGEGFAPLGLKVLMALLDNTTGRRILIDVKHLSYKARSQYFNLLAGTIPGDLVMDAALEAEVRAFFRFNTAAGPGMANAVPPVIASHAAVNGYRDPGNKFYYGNYPAQTAEGVLNPFENSPIYADPSINFYDADLLNIARFKGLAGIQLDMHRIAGAAGLAVAAAQPYSHAYLVWNQVLHMVELWDGMGIRTAWDHVCLGSDFDGIISPMDGMHRASDYPQLREGLLYYCRLYLMSTADFVREQPGMGERGIIANRFQLSGHNPSGRRLSPAGANAPEQSGLWAEQIVEKICAGNALAFMRTYFV